MCVKKSKTELQELEPGERIVVGRAGQLGCTEPGVGQLVVDTRDHAVTEVIFRHPELRNIDVIDNSDVPFDRSLLDMGRPQGVLFCHMTCRELPAW